MKEKAAIFFRLNFLFILSACMLLSRVYAYDDNDFQVWNTDYEEKKINEKFKISLEEEFRWGDNASELYYQHYEPGITYIVDKYWDVSLKYRHIYDKKGDKFKVENQPNLNANLRWEFLNFPFENRFRLEYRHFDYQVDSWLYRDKIMVKSPWKFTKFAIQPYLANEIFVNFYNTTFSRNRFYAGLGFAFTKNVKAEIYYLLQSTKSSHKWSAANVLGTAIKLLF
ncbi:MAG: DUF2490 domain-containing protein [Candidatus Omnitrophota bacterium]